jgi:hypothetical protein
MHQEKSGNPVFDRCKENMDKKTILMLSLTTNSSSNRMKAFAAENANEGHFLQMYDFFTNVYFYTCIFTNV